MSADLKRVSEEVDEEEVLRLAMEMTDIVSPTGEEGEMGRYVFDRCQALGLRARLQQVSEGRFNVLATREGTGEGPTLMLNGHLDTSYSGREKELQGIGFKPKAVLIEDPDETWIYGAGTNNMKSALAGFLGAIGAIQKAKVRLKGDLVFAAVVGEIEKGPIDEFQGVEYAGYGTGARYLVTHGGMADYCIVGEPSAFAIVPGHMGSVWVQLTTRGTMAHTAWSDRAINAIDQMDQVRAALKGWVPGYQERNTYRGTRPGVNISAIEGGWRWRASRVPVFCKLSVDVRINPEQHPLEVYYELRALLQGLRARDPKLDVECELYSTNPGTVIPEDSPPVRAVRLAHELYFEEPPRVEYAGYISDATTFNRYGILAFNYGLGGRVRTGGSGFDPAQGEHQSVKDLVAGAKIYAMAAIEICSKTRKELGLPR